MGPSERYQDFKAKTANLGFTKDFHTSLEAIMHDPLATVGERILAWLKRCAWGNYSLYAIHTRVTGASDFSANEPDTPRHQCDCAKELGIDKRQVSNAIRYLEKRGYVRVEGKLLYPVIAPVFGPESKVTDASDFQAFVEEWKVTNASDFQELEVARAAVERLRKVMLSEYKKWRAPATDPTPILIQDIEIKEERAGGVCSTVDRNGKPPALNQEGQDFLDRIKRHREDQARRFRDLLPMLLMETWKAYPNERGPLIVMRMIHQWLECPMAERVRADAPAVARTEIESKTLTTAEETLFQYLETRRWEVGDRWRHFAIDRQNKGDRALVRKVIAILGTDERVVGFCDFDRRIKHSRPESLGIVQLWVSDYIRALPRKPIPPANAPSNRLTRASDIKLP